VRCIERRAAALLAVAIVLAGCSSGGPESARTAGGVTVVTPTAPVVLPPSTGPNAAAQEGARGAVRLAAPAPVRSWAELREQAAQRLVAANPQGTYLGAVPETLLAIPVLEIELNGDGSVRRIVVLRPPRQAKDTIEIAAAAVRRAAPFGDVSRLPRPWKFVETFLFDDDRRFKPRTLD
jgi:hypothetical protein